MVRDKVLGLIRGTDQGQGGCQAIEDGAALGVLLADSKPGDNIEPRLALVESVRKWRTSTIQYMSNVAQDQQELSEEKVRQVIGDRDVPSGYSVSR